MFIDQIKVSVRAGHGGKGCVAFHREAYIPKGGPSGGNGGRGGSVILQADHDLNNLIAQYYQPRLLAKDGEFGKGKGMDGHAGQELIVKVPCGTLVWKLNSAGSPEAAAEETDAVEEKAGFIVSSSRRHLIRHAGGACVMDVDLSEEA